MQLAIRVLYRTDPGHPKPWTCVASIGTTVDARDITPATPIWFAEQVYADWNGTGTGRYRVIIDNGPPGRWMTVGDAVIIEELETTLIADPLGWDTSQNIPRGDIDWTGSGITPQWPGIERAAV